jgi:hypothetical protein
VPKSGEDAIPDPESWGVSAGDARELLRHQMCPICGRGPWKSPLNHVALKHGIDKFTMRDICGLKVKESVADADLSEASRQRAAAQDKTALHEAHKQGHGKYRVTRAGAKGKADGTAGVDMTALRDRAFTPEALAKRSDSWRRTWEAKSPEAKQATLDRLYEAKKPSLRPCGTVAAYGRGCRCDLCRAAHTAYRRARREPGSAHDSVAPDSPPDNRHAL